MWPWFSDSVEVVSVVIQVWYRADAPVSMSEGVRSPLPIELSHVWWTVSRRDPRIAAYPESCMWGSSGDGHFYVSRSRNMDDWDYRISIRDSRYPLVYCQKRDIILNSSNHKKKESEFKKNHYRHRKFIDRQKTNRGTQRFLSPRGAAGLILRLMSITLDRALVLGIGCGYAVGVYVCGM